MFGYNVPRKMESTVSDAYYVRICVDNKFLREIAWNIRKHKTSPPEIVFSSMAETKIDIALEADEESAGTRYWTEKYVFRFEWSVWGMYLLLGATFAGTLAGITAGRLIY